MHLADGLLATRTCQLRREPRKLLLPASSTRCKTRASPPRRGPWLVLHHCRCGSPVGRPAPPTGLLRGSPKACGTGPDGLLFFLLIVLLLEFGRQREVGVVLHAGEGLQATRIRRRQPKPRKVAHAAVAHTPRLWRGTAACLSALAPRFHLDCCPKTEDSQFQLVPLQDRES